MIRFLLYFDENNIRYRILRSVQTAVYKGDGHKGMKEHYIEERVMLAGSRLYQSIPRTNHIKYTIKRYGGPIVEILWSMLRNMTFLRHSSNNLMN